VPEQTGPPNHHPDEAPDSEQVAERPRVPERPAHRSIGDIGLVAVGGATGTALRYGLTLVLPPVHGIPVAILTANVVGAFVLGLLLESLSGLRLDRGTSRRLRLGVGTGVLGGFTTYSTLAADTVTLGLSDLLLAGAYGAGTVIIGALASILGIVLARRLIRPVIRQRRLAS